MTELVVFALTVRTLRGNSDDEFTITPATIAEDRGIPGAATLTGFDFNVRHRPSGLELHVQAKTSDVHTGVYDPAIAIVQLNNIASGFGRQGEVRLLEKALIADGEGSARPDQVDHIAQATRRLEMIYLTKLVENSEQQKTA